MACLSEKRRSLYREQLLHYLQSHAAGRIIPSEQCLAEALHLNRYLIRKHLEEFTQEGILERNGRKRILREPSAPSREVYGLITGDGSQFSYLDSPHIVTGLIDRLTDHKVLIRHFSFRTEEQIATRIREQGLSALIWIIPSISKYSAMLSRLICEQHLPLVVTSTFILEKNLSPLNHNIVTEDLYPGQVARARFFSTRDCRNILYFSPKCGHLDIFRKCLSSQGIVLQDDCIIPRPAELMKKLPGLLKKYPIDGILCDGELNFNENLFACLNKFPHFNPVLRLENHRQVKALLKKYHRPLPEFQNEKYENWERRLGEKTAEMAIRAARENPLQKCEYVPQIIIDPKTRD